MSALKAHLKQIYDKLDQHTGGLLNIFQRTIIAYGQDDGPALATSIAYHALFSFFPLILLLLALSSILVNSTEAQEQVVAFVESFLPAAGDLVRDNVATILRARGAIGVFATLGLLWSASNVFAAIDRAINRAWGTTVQRPFWQQKALAIAIVGSIGLFFFVSNLTTTAYNLQMSIRLPWSGDIPFGNNFLYRWLPLLAPILLDYIVFLMLYRFLPIVRVRWLEVLPGALLAGTAWQVAKTGFNFYLRSFARYNLVYGSVTTIIAFLMFAYIAAGILVIGAEFIATLTRSRRERKQPTVRNDKDLAHWIAENNVAAEVICLPVETPTVQTAAAAVNVQPQAILKSLIFLAKGQPYLIIANGLAKIDRARLSAHWGIGKKRIKLASAEKVLQLTGYPVGAVPPFGHHTLLPTLVDPAVLDQPVLYAGGGSVQALVKLTPEELLRIAKPQLIRLTATPQGKLS